MKAIAFVKTSFIGSVLLLLLVGLGSIILGEFEGFKSLIFGLISFVIAFILSSIASLPLLLFIQIDPDQKPLASVRKAQKVQVIFAIFYLILGCTLIFINTSKPALKDFVPYIGVCALYLVVGLYIWEKEILKNQKHA